MKTPATLTELLEAGTPARPALVVSGGPQLTHARLRELVAEAADRLAELGVGGERVALAYSNGAEAVAFFLAAATVGTACPLNPAYKEEEFRFYLADTGARVLLVPPGGGGAAGRALPPRGVLVEAAVEPGGRLRLEASGRLRPGRTGFAPDPEQVALVLHTSGTTSRPKRVPLRHRNLVSAVHNVIETYRLGEDDATVALMPLFHVHGLVASALATLASGGTLVVPAPFNALTFWSLLEEHPVSWWSASPTPHRMVLSRVRGRRLRSLGRLRFVRSCSAALPPTLMQEMEALYGVPVLEAYGMTEASHQMASNPLPPKPRRAGTVGLPTGVELGVMDAQRRLSPAGTEGEVVVRGPSVIDAYEDNPEANAACFSGDWFRTGDQGVLDDLGYLRLVGRIKELINRGGEKISPSEVDQVLEAHPAVKEAVSFGRPHPGWGEEVAAAVVLRQPASVRELQAWCRERLADFKVPSVIYVVEAIPRTPTGKVQRTLVAASLVDSR